MRFKCKFNSAERNSQVKWNMTHANVNLVGRLLHVFMRMVSI